MSTRKFRGSAAALTAIAAAIAVMMSMIGGSSVTFAQVAESLKKIRSMTCTATTVMPGDNVPVMMKMEQLERVMRTEIAGSIISVVNKETGELMILNPMLKSATLTKLSAEGTLPTPNDPIADLRTLANQKGNSLGTKHIGKIEAEGIHCTVDGRDVTVWVNPATKLPIRVELEAEVNGHKMNTIIDDLAFDVPLDENRFRFEVPEGYARTEQVLTFNRNIEDNVITLLKTAGDKYPSSITDSTEMIHRLIENAEGQDLKNEQLTKVATAAGSLQGLLFSYEKGKTYDYYPDSKPGEEEVVVFWRKDKESGKYLAVFGNMTVRQVPQNQIPPPAPARPALQLSQPSAARGTEGAARVIEGALVAPPPIKVIPQQTPPKLPNN